MSKQNWIPHYKGDPQDGFEICVIRQDNKHGLMSYGWFDENKIMISSSGGPCNDKVPTFVWSRLMNLAEEIAMELNIAEREPIEVTATERQMRALTGGEGEDVG